MHRWVRSQSNLIAGRHCDEKSPLSFLAWSVHICQQIYAGTQRCIGWPVGRSLLVRVRGFLVSLPFCSLGHRRWPHIYVLSGAILQRLHGVRASRSGVRFFWVNVLAVRSHTNTLVCALLFISAARFQNKIVCSCSVGSAQKQNTRSPTFAE
jgi:hypothetical protein